MLYVLPTLLDLVYSTLTPDSDKQLCLLTLIVRVTTSACLLSQATAPGSFKPGFLLITQFRVLTDHPACVLV